MIIDIMRHAETHANAEGRLQGKEDLLLSANGVIQAEHINSTLIFDYDLVFCSSLKRTQQTLSLIMGKSIEESLGPVEIFGQILVTDHLREIDLGILEGMIVKEMNEEHKSIWRLLTTDQNYIGHGGESPSQFFRRVNNFISELQELSTVPDFKKILLVTHNGVIQILFKYIMGIEPPLISNADMIRIEVKKRNLHFLGKVMGSDEIKMSLNTARK